MLDADTKRRIDAARDILVGKVPDPKSQVEQITIALIYKFMDDMDAESEELGGKRKFFESDFARYGWAKLMRSGLGGFEVLNLYAEAIARMPENPGIPPLFRSIFKNAYLPYRDPETLKMFLKVIDEFNYDHSERLGDAFEYLLSVLGSQGQAGQFRTPRHIIDFIVEIVDPKKNETALDPACGTAGFLISSYKHILKANVDAEGHSTLTPDEKGRLADNFRGYDISPDMVRLSLVNMYLHGFTDPHIYEYDTLTSQDRWNEHADVILANPPFMSPKGGIKPHNRFTVQSKRSEVLFVDYIAEHLAPNGRGGIIVPEGIIFQSQSAYKRLRKMLVNEYLVAVFSLPAGVFNPYSGVKTSILILDKSLAKKTDSILFVRIENDGTDLGARRKTVADSELPDGLSIYRRWVDCICHGRQYNASREPRKCATLSVEKKHIASGGSYDLTAERYRTSDLGAGHRYPITRIGDHIKESTLRARDGVFPVWSVSNQVGLVNTEDYFNKKVASEDISNYKIVGPGFFAYNPARINVGSIALNTTDTHGAVSPMYVVFSVAGGTLDKEYLFALLKSPQVNREINRVAQGAIRTQLRFDDLADIRIPTPPMEAQQEILADIRGCQKVIDGARAVVGSYRPHIPISPDWPMVELGSICSFKNGLNFSQASSGYAVKIIGVRDFQDNLHAPLSQLEEVHLDAVPSEAYFVQDGDIIFVRSNGNPDLVGRSVIVSTPSQPTTFSGFTIRGRFHDKRALPLFYAHLFKSRDFAEIVKTIGQGANIRNLSQQTLGELRVPIPPLAAQHAIVAEIEADQALINANHELITRFELKIQATLARVWGEAEPIHREE